MRGGLGISSFCAAALLWPGLAWTGSVSVPRLSQAPTPFLKAPGTAGLPAALPSSQVVALPSGQALLQRAAERGISLESIGAAIASARSLTEAVAGLQNAGLLQPGEAAATEGDALSARYLLERLWYESAPRTPGAFQMDSSWAVPSFKVENGGRVYHVHGVVHGHGAAGGLLKGHPAQKLVKQLRSQGLPLYSERGLPNHFSFEYGRETQERMGQEGSAPQPLDARLNPGFAGARKFFDLVSLAAWALPVSLIISDPGSAWGWAALSACAMLHYAVWTAFKPYYYVKNKVLGWLKSLQADSDAGHYFGKLAKHYFGLSWRPELLRRTELPMPLGEGLFPSSAARGRAIAQAVRAEAEAKGLPEVHILTGYNHAQEAAWYLSQATGAGPKVP